MRSEETTSNPERRATGRNDDWIANQHAQWPTKDECSESFDERDWSAEAHAQRLSEGEHERAQAAVRAQPFLRVLQVGRHGK